MLAASRESEGAVGGLLGKYRRGRRGAGVGVTGLEGQCGRRRPCEGWGWRRRGLGLW